MNTILGMNASLAKIPFICSVLWGIDRSMTPPRPPPPPTDRLPVQGNFIEQYAIPAVGFLKKVMLVPGFIEVATILAGSYPDAPGAPWVLRYLLPPGGLDTLHLTAPFLAGWALNLAGTLLRIHCYRKLDRHFTYELAVQKDQKLVTDGVYGIVRHPSYTAAVVACIGFYMAQLCPGSWVYEYIGLRATAALGTGLLAMMVVGLGKRIRTEDDMLKNNFGKQWQEWAKRVPYKIIPGLI